MVREIPFSGQLRERHLSAVLHMLHRRQLTGILHVRLSDLDKLIYFKEGEIIFAASTYPDDRLDIHLLKLGKITYAQYEAIDRTYKISMFRSNRAGIRKGTIMVEHGILTPKALYDAVIAQVKEIILSLFTWIGGEYEFKEGDLPSEEVITLKISTADLILEGIRRVADWTWLVRGLPPFESHLRFTKDPRDLFQIAHLDANEASLINQLNGKSIRNLLTSSSLPAFHTLQLIYFFVSAGIVEIGQAPSPEDQEITRGIIIEEIRETLSKKDRISSVSLEEIREAYRNMERQNYYQILGITPHDSREEIKRAYYRLAKLYHPDRHFEEAFREVKKELEALFAKIKEAYDHLSNDTKRAEYNASLSRPKETSQPKPLGIAEQAEHCFNQGKEAYTAGAFKQAADLFEAAARLIPDNHRYFGYLGKTLLHFPERLRRAEMAFREAVTLQPDEIEYYTELARLYEQRGMLRRALKEYEEALKRNPENPVLKESLHRLKTKV